MSYNTHSATIAITELEYGLTTTHHRGKREFVRNILRNRDYFQLIAEEFQEAKAIWDEEAKEDARWESLTPEQREAESHD